MPNRSQILQYECSWCGLMEPVWHPLLVEPPMVILCAACGFENVASRVDALTEAVFDFIAPAGHASFREGTPDDAIETLRRKQRFAEAAANQERFGADASARAYEYYERQIEAVQDGVHPSFPPGYLICIR